MMGTYKAGLGVSGLPSGFPLPAYLTQHAHLLSVGRFWAQLTYMVRAEATDI